MLASSARAADSSAEHEDSQAEWARQEQEVRKSFELSYRTTLTIGHIMQLMIRQQDETIDSIAGTLSTLAAQAGLMGQEIVEHNECVSIADISRHTPHIVPECLMI